MHLEGSGAVRRPHARRTASRAAENGLRRLGFLHIAGVDEVGRGCLAGPVTAAAVILDPRRGIPGVCDSKLATAAHRDALYAVVTRRALAWAVASASPEEIDRINIHQASFLAMRMALSALVPNADCVLVDGFRLPGLLVPQRRVIGGDRLCAAIAAASIVAKVTRDRMMQALHGEDPRYGFDRHKGYATADHLAAVSRHGYSAVHRRSFRPPSLFDLLDASREQAESASLSIDERDGLS